MQSDTVKYFKFTILFLLLISEVFSILMVFIILRTLRQKASKFSKYTLKLHFQFTLLLALQLAVPFLIVILPVSVRLIKTFMGDVPPKFAIQLGYILISCYGLINSLLTLIFIGPFRDHFKQCLMFLLGKIVRNGNLNLLSLRKIGTVSSTVQQ